MDALTRLLRPMGISPPNRADGFGSGLVQAALYLVVLARREFLLEPLLHDPFEELGYADLFGAGRCQKTACAAPR